MRYRDIMQKSMSLCEDRGEQYGTIEETMERACTIYTTMTGESMTPYLANMFMLALKLARVRYDRSKGDSYFDGINYFAFAAEAANVRDDVPVPFKVPEPPSPHFDEVKQIEKGIEESMQELAAEFAAKEKAEAEKEDVK